MKKILWLILTAITFYSYSQDTLPNYESFETGFGIWQQASGDDLDWTRWEGSTPTQYTGPDTAYDGTYYIYVEADPDNWNPARKAALVGTFDFSDVQVPMLSFYYYMYGQYINNLTVKISTDSINWTELTTIIGDQGQQWHREILCLGDYAGNDTVYIAFIAYTSDDPDITADQCDIALDKIDITDFRLQDSSHTDVTCGGYQDGKISLAVSGGFKPYQYSRDDGGIYTDPTNDTTHVFDSLAGGTYIIKVLSAGTCSLPVGAVTVKEPPKPTVLIDTQYVKPCVYSHNGAIKVIASNGNGPYTYSITGVNGTFSTDTLYENLDTGAYDVVVKDSFGCIFDQGETRIDPYYEIQYLGYDKQDVNTCYGDNSGAITIHATGGNQPLMYSIDTGKTYYNSYYFSGLYAGDYFVIIQDQSGCTDTTDTITITQPPKLVISSVQITDVQGCYGDSTGQLKITATGGSGPLRYSIDGGVIYDANNVFDSLPAGEYHIYVRDTNDCQAGPDTAVITQPPQLVINSISQTNITGCYGDSTGSIEISADGGTPSLYYSIDNGKSYQLINLFENLPAGTYYPVVKDAAGCTVTADAITITQPDQLVLNSVSKTDVETCYGDSTGQIILYATGGSTPLSYSVDSGKTQSADNIFKNLPAGTYYPKVTDSHGCFVFGDSVTLTQPDSITILEQTSTDVICYGDKTGSVFVNATGGTAPLVYSIDSGKTFPYQINTKVDVYAGNYQIAVQDVNGCKTFGKLLIVNQPPDLVIDTVYKQDVNTCYGDSTGQIIISASGGTPPYKYSIDYGNTYQADSVFDSLPASTNYFPYITDSHGCVQGYQYVSINQPSPLIIDKVNHTDIDTCHGVAIGTISINVVGGTTPYYFSIDSGSSYQDTNFFGGLRGGDYYVFVKDAHNCTTHYNGTVSVYEPDTLILDSITYHDISCSGYQDGSAIIYAHGGEPQLVYFLYSSDNDTLVSVSNYFQSLKPISYKVIVKDKFNCQVKDSFTLSEPPKLYIDTVFYTDIEKCYGDSSGTITTIARGGTKPVYYSYYKLGYGQSSFQTDSVFDKLTAGSYYVIIMDAHGCTDQSEAFTLTQPTAVNLKAYGSTPISCYKADDGQIWMQATGGQGVYFYSVDNGSTWQPDSLFTNLSPGTYNLRVKDTNDCQSTSTPIVTLKEPDSLYIENIYSYDVTCYGYSDGRISISAKGGTSPVVYSIDDTNYSDLNYFYNLSPGTYTAYVKDAHGCKAEKPGIIIHDQINYALFDATPTEGCSPLTVSLTAQNTNALFTWYFSDDSNLVQTSSSVTHTFYNHTTEYKTFNVSLIAKHDFCVDSFSREITLYPAPQLQIDIDSTVNYYPDTIVNFYNHTLQYDDYTWDYGDGQTENISQPLQHAYPGCGTYLLQVSAKNYLGCYDTLKQSIIITAVNPTASFTMDNNEGCSPLTVNFFNTSSNAYKYVWDFGDGNTSTEVNPEHIFTQGQNYMVKLKALGYCGKTDETEAPVYVYPTPKVDFYIDPDTVLVGEIVGFYNLTQGATYYFWNFGDGTVSMETEPRRAYSQPGIYDVKLVAQSENGCVDSLTKKAAVNVIGTKAIKFATAFTPNGDGINDLYVPKMELVHDAQLYIFDRYGRIVFYTDKPDQEFWDGTYRGKPLPQDVYVWKMVGHYVNGQSFIQKGEVTLLR